MHKIEVPKDLLIELDKVRKLKENIIETDYSASESSYDFERSFSSRKMAMPAMGAAPNPSWIHEQELKPSFYDLIIKYADKLGIKDSDLYKSAYVDRRLFSKIRSGHKPGIKTVIRLGLVLELNMEEFNELLHSCNYSLYEDEYFDVAIKYFIKNKIYNINKFNNILYSCNLELLNDYN